MIQPGVDDSLQRDSACNNSHPRPDAARHVPKDHSNPSRPHAHVPPQRIRVIILVDRGSAVRLGAASGWTTARG